MIDKTSTIVDLFLQRQHRLIPGSVEGGFSIFSSLLEIIKQDKTKFHEAVSILKEKKMGFEDFSLIKTDKTDPLKSHNNWLKVRHHQ